MTLVTHFPTALGIWEKGKLELIFSFFQQSPAIKRSVTCVTTVTLDGRRAPQAPPTPPRRRSYTRASLETAQPGKTGIARVREASSGPALSPAGPALLAAQPLADCLDLAPPASLMAAHSDGQRVEALDMATRWAPGAQPIAPADEVAHGARMLSAHVMAMPRTTSAGKGGREQDGNKPVDRSDPLIHNQRTSLKSAAFLGLSRLCFASLTNRHQIGDNRPRNSGGKASPDLAPLSSSPAFP